MTLLPNFPLISQLSQVTEDGSVSNNAVMDCVAASVLAGCMYLNGIKTVGGNYTVDWFKDTAYSETYTGGTAASAYVPLCKSLGIDLYPYDNSNAANLIQEVRNQLALSHPVIFTIVDPWVDTSLPQYRGWTHVDCFFGCDASGLTALDPYSGKPVYKSDATWASLLVAGEIWILQKEDIAVQITLSTPGVSAWFEIAPGDPTAWLCKSKGKIVHGEILATYCRYGGIGLCGLTEWGLPQSNEFAIEDLGAGRYAHLSGKGIRVQWFERRVSIFDPLHLYDNPPGSGSVYGAHLYDGGVGTDPTLVTQIMALEAEIAALKAIPPPIVPTPLPPSQGLVDKFNEIKTLQGQISPLQAQMDAVVATA